LFDGLGACYCPAVSEAQDLLLERVRQEIAGILGPRVAVVEIVPRVGPNGVVLTAECRTPLGPWRIEAEGASVVHAAGRLIERATEDRLAIAFREVVTAP
jgi:hypothetical protein